MSLHIVATPIGNRDDLSPRAFQCLQGAEFVIGEEMKPTTRLLKAHGLTPKKIRLLNEHSSQEDLKELVELCRVHRVALVSDCGTPGFCDPGPDLVRLCQTEKIRVQSLPGPSSLTAFLSMSGQAMGQFVFLGFLPAKNPQRTRAFGALGRISSPHILMDTPYRLKRTLCDLQKSVPGHFVILGLDLSTEREWIFRGRPGEILQNLDRKEAPFILAVLPPE